MLMACGGNAASQPLRASNVSVGSKLTKAPVWLAQSSRCKTGPSKAVAGRSVVSVA